MVQIQNTIAAFFDAILEEYHTKHNPKKKIEKLEYFVLGENVNDKVREILREIAFRVRG